MKAHPADVLTLMKGKVVSTDRSMQKTDRLVNYLTGGRCRRTSDFFKKHKGMTKRLAIEFPHLARAKVPDFNSPSFRSLVEARLGDEYMTSLKETMGKIPNKVDAKQYYDESMANAGLQMYAQELLENHGKLQLERYEAPQEGLALVEYESAEAASTEESAPATTTTTNSSA
jgi:hypothetical protein